jgi:hypothetical protein
MRRRYECDTGGSPVSGDPLIMRCNAAGHSVRYDLSVRKDNGTWPSLVKALVWGTREPGFKSRRPDC